MLKQNTDHLRGVVKALLLDGAEVKRQTALQCLDSIFAASNLIAETFRCGGKVLLCGNGGSAADCQHMATELVARLSKDIERPGLPAIALTTDTSFITAYANDYGYEGIFMRQVEALGKENDLLIGISTSGESENIILAVKTAQGQNMRTVALSGMTGRLKDLTDIAITIPSSDTQFIQESHLAVEHVLCYLVEQYLFPLEKKHG